MGWRRDSCPDGGQLHSVQEEMQQKQKTSPPLSSPGTSRRQKDGSSRTKLLT